MTYRELERKLLSDEWKLDRQTGSHKIYTHDKKQHVIVLSGHLPSDQVGKGMLHKIMKQAGWK